MAARYIPGADVGVGGDWYDLFRLPSGYIGIVIGDVAGSGLRAAVVMGRIRSALRAYALETDDPADVLSRLDRKVQIFEPGAMATVIYAVLDSDLANLTLSNAGHPPPIIATSKEPARLVKAKPEVPIGVYGDAVRHNIRVLVPGGACLFFYTDGLVERHDRSIVDGMDQLAASLACGPAETMCTTAMTQLFDSQPVNDDTAMLAIRRTPPGPNE